MAVFRLIDFVVTLYFTPKQQIAEDNMLDAPFNLHFTSMKTLSQAQLLHISLDDFQHYFQHQFPFVGMIKTKQTIISGFLPTRITD